MFHNFSLPFSPVNKYEKINTQLLFSTINIKKIIEPWIFQLFAAKPFPRSFVNYNDLNLQENLKLNVAITFQCLFFGIRIDQSIAFQVTKVTKGEDPSAEVPRRGGVRAQGLLWEGRRKGTFTCPCYPHLQGLFWPRRVYAAEQVVDIWPAPDNLTVQRLKHFVAWKDCELRLAISGLHVRYQLLNSMTLVKIEGLGGTTLPKLSFMRTTTRSLLAHHVKGAKQ